MSSIFELWDDAATPSATGIPAPARRYSGSDHPYAIAVLRRCCHEIRQMQPQTGRDNALNAAAYMMGGYIAAGHISEQLVRDELYNAGRASGQSDGEVRRALRADATGGLVRGREQPRGIPPRNGVATVNDEPRVEPPSDSELDKFWDARELLTHIRTYARARRTSPWAVLGVVLARVVAATPPTVVLPAMVGGHASLNLFVGLVGASGSGKGAAERVAAECLHIGEHLTTVTTGSGEGIAHAYKRRTRTGVESITDAVLFSVPEIDTLSALGARKGATLMPELRRGWSGEALGFAYADPTKRLPVDAHTYRMCLVAGIQPARARTLLDDADGGTPQRFIWCSAVDRHAPDIAPDAPQPMTWTRPAWTLAQRDSGPFGSGRLILDVCDTARQVVDDARRDRVRGDGDALDGHALLAQLKTAAALAIADSRVDITDDDWHLAELIMKQSTAVRANVAEALATEVATKNRTRAEGDAQREDIAAGELHEKWMRRGTRAVLRKLDKTDGDWVARHDLRRAVQYRDRNAFDNVIDALLSTGQIERDGDENSERFRKA